MMRADSRVSSSTELSDVALTVKGHPRLSRASFSSASALLESVATTSVPQPAPRFLDSACSSLSSTVVLLGRSSWAPEC